MATDHNRLELRMRAGVGLSGVFVVHIHCIVRRIYRILCEATTVAGCHAEERTFHLLTSFLLIRGTESGYANLRPLAPEIMGGAAAALPHPRASYYTYYTVPLAENIP